MHACTKRLADLSQSGGQRSVRLFGSRSAGPTARGVESDRLRRSFTPPALAAKPAVPLPTPHALRNALYGSSYNQEPSEGVSKVSLRRNIWTCVTERYFPCSSVRFILTLDDQLPIGEWIEFL
jgi:hypothetical protein